MLTKTKKQDYVEVVFAMPPIEDCESLCLCGDFNNWDLTTHPVQKAPDGGWTLAMHLDSDRDYEFRYYANTGVWYDEPSADAYRPNPYGSNNSVVSTKLNDESS